jgi:hypothetical protein
VRQRALPAKPRRAIVFGKATAVMSSIAAACDREGVTLHAIGGPAAPVSPDPEQMLADCDIVFATARAASEAIACGCAVVLVDARGFGGPVTADNYRECARNNFGLRCLTAPPEIDQIVKAIQHFDPKDAVKVTEEHRAERGIDRLLDHAERLYADMLTEPVSDAEFLPALAKYLRQFTPHKAPNAGWPWQREQIHLQQQIDALTAENTLLTRQLRQLTAKLE